MSTGKELYQAGRLDEAIEALNAAVRTKPTDTDARGLLAELVCYTGNHERADRLIDQLGTQDPTSIPGYAVIRQLIRGDLTRREVFGQGRLPEFLDAPPDWMKLHLEASIALREGRGAEALAKLAEAEAMRPVVRGTCDDIAFDEFRDIDDLAAGLVEVITTSGAYYWIPLDRVETIAFEPPRRPRELLWRRAKVEVRNGPDGEVFLPALYPGSSDSKDDSIRLGRSTDWSEVADAPVTGLGQRCYLVGDELVPMLQIQTLTIAA
jgi:type VI secretion system protein ImpE